MLAEWSAECGEDAPQLVVPWADAEAGLRFVNLRTDPYELAEIGEAEAFPALRRALRSLNAPRSAFLTAKCDVWTFTARDENLEALRVQLMLAEENANCGQSCYIDLLWRERVVFASQHKAAGRLDSFVRRASRLPHPEAAIECVLRPAVVDLAEPVGSYLEGYAFSMYVSALGADPDTASRRWEAALDDAVEMLRDRELAVPPGSATIDAVAQVIERMGE